MKNLFVKSSPISACLCACDMKLFLVSSFLLLLCCSAAIAKKKFEGDFEFVDEVCVMVVLFVHTFICVCIFI